MRIVLGIVALVLLLFVIDAPVTRGLTDWVKEQVTAWTADQDTESAASVAPEPVSGLAMAGCQQIEEKSCDIRKRHSCGPMTLDFSAVPNGASRCERAIMMLPATRVIPLLRQVRCLLVGSDTQIRFTAENYLPQQGPHDGDTIEVRNGSSDLIVNGHYERAGEQAQISFENIGPGDSVVLKCEAFGPA